jgi:hypothetical protein
MSAAPGTSGSAKCAARTAAADHRYYAAPRERRNTGLATLATWTVTVWLSATCHRIARSGHRIADQRDKPLSSQAGR